jgi:predicted RNA-binding protein YlxR (DUF448 family)
MQKFPIRKCLICRKDRERNLLLRIMNDHKDGTVIVNPTNKQFGRSSYICQDDEECLKRLAKHKKYAKYFAELK